MLHLRLHHPSRGCRCYAPSLALLSIPGEQISTLCLCLYHPSRGSKSYISWTIKSVSKTFIIYFRGTNLNAPPTPYSGGADHTPHGRLSPLPRQGLYVYYNLPALPPKILLKPQKSQKPPRKTRKNHTATLPTAFHFFTTVLLLGTCLKPTPIPICCLPRGHTTASSPLLPTSAVYPRSSPYLQLQQLFIKADSVNISAPLPVSVTKCSDL